VPGSAAFVRTLASKDPLAGLDGISNLIRNNVQVRRFDDLAFLVWFRPLAAFPRLRIFDRRDAAERIVEHRLELRTEMVQGLEPVCKG
jgi:hypothetical protein